ncbi:MAG: 50S ribosomal protein L24 [Candidatus Lokiarchaeota archaeon]|nr:50S ribosomal protein L24 [Candidatus Lokiarchaeota archaeon]
MKVKSKQPSKQRKALYNYKNHQRSKLFSTRVADFLRDEYGIKKLPVRVGDSVRITKGEFKDFEGEVLEITKNMRCKIKEAQFEKSDGTQFHPAIHVSNLLITKFAKEKKLDPWRAQMIERKALYGFYDEELKGPKKEKEEDKYD